MSRRMPQLDPSRDAIAERQWIVRSRREFLDAVAEGRAYKVTRATHRGCLVEIITALRPDGRAQVTAETVTPDGSAHTRFWLVEQSQAAEALVTALREACAHIDRSK